MRFPLYAVSSALSIFRVNKESDSSIPFGKKLSLFMVGDHRDETIRYRMSDAAESLTERQPYSLFAKNPKISAQP